MLWLQRLAGQGPLVGSSWVSAWAQRSIFKQVLLQRMPEVPCFGARLDLQALPAPVQQQGLS